MVIFPLMATTWRMGAGGDQDVLLEGAVDNKLMVVG
jgi:hypothetical protein